ncbi:MAG TPA: hypothetical protein VJ385_10310 [Fibrobacteria bacterium]|nr:hypothetical protein [Fibrobacteria bacterium]
MILLCAATLGEMDACLAAAGLRFGELEPREAPEKARGEAIAAALIGHRIWARGRGGLLCAVTGVGIPLTLLRLLPLASRTAPELIFNAGIAGAYPGSGLSIGDVVAGESETFGDLGMETPGPETFLPLASFPWADEDYRRPLPLALEPLRRGGRDGTPGLPVAGGCTINACAGTEATGRLRRSRTGAGFETMEGAAAALVGRELGIPVCEVRAISNIASTRDFRPAGAEMALGNLGVYMGRWLAGLPGFGREGNA